jgi:hypothetical protein
MPQPHHQPVRRKIARLRILPTKRDQKITKLRLTMLAQSLPLTQVWIPVRVAPQEKHLQRVRPQKLKTLKGLRNRKTP